MEVLVEMLLCGRHLSKETAHLLRSLFRNNQTAGMQFPDPTRPPHPQQWTLDQRRTDVLPTFRPSQNLIMKRSLNKKRTYFLFSNQQTIREFAEKRLGRYQTSCESTGRWLIGKVVSQGLQGAHVRPDWGGGSPWRNLSKPIYWRFDCD